MELRLSEILNERNISIPEFAKMCNVSKNTMYSQLRGNPTLETMQKWAALLGITIAELFEKRDIVIQCPHCHNPLTIKIE